MSKKLNSYYMRNYGITYKQYQELHKKQNHRCAICKKHQRQFTRRLAVDHDHSTGEVRGLLCFFDNKRMVGRHTKETVVKLVEYLLPNMKLVEK